MVYMRLKEWGKWALRSRLDLLIFKYVNSFVLLGAIVAVLEISLRDTPALEQSSKNKSTQIRCLTGLLLSTAALMLSCMCKSLRIGSSVASLKVFVFKPNASRSFVLNKCHMCRTNKKTSRRRDASLMRKPDCQYILNHFLSVQLRKAI